MKSLLAESKRIGKHLAKMSMTPTPRRPQADLDIVAYHLEGQRIMLKRKISGALRSHL